MSGYISRFGFADFFLAIFLARGVCVMRKKKVFRIPSADVPRVNQNDVVSFVESKRLDEFAEDVRPKIFARAVISYDDAGNEISHSVSRVQSQNGSGFVLSYSDKVCDFVSKVTQPTILRVFFYLAHNQHHELGGFRVSRKHISEALNIDSKSVYSALRWLQENYLVLESRIDGQLEFMVNPNYVTVGANKKARLSLWNSRWKDYWSSTKGSGKFKSR